MECVIIYFGLCITLAFFCVRIYFTTLIALCGEVSEEGLDPSTGSGQRFLGAHIFGVALIVKKDEVAGLIYIRLFSMVGVMFEANGSAHLIEKFFGHRRLTFSTSSSYNN